MRTKADIIFLTGKQYWNTVIDMIRSAEKSILFLQYEMILTPLTRHKKSCGALSLALKEREGVPQKIAILNSKLQSKLYTQYQRATANFLRRLGFEVYTAKWNKRIHSKVICTDKRYTVLGSANITPALLSGQHETGIYIDSRILAERIWEEANKIIKEYT